MSFLLYIYHIRKNLRSNLHIYQRLLFRTIAFFSCIHIAAQGDTARVNALNIQAWATRHSDLDSAILIVNQALELLENIKEEKTWPANWKQKARAKSLFYLGSFYNQKGEDSLCLLNLNKALDISRRIGDERGISVATGGIGLFHSNRGNFPKALEHFFESLKIDEKIGYREGVLTRLGNIGVVYDYQQNYDKALEYYNRALKIAEEMQRLNSISIQYCNIGVVYYEKKDHDRALGYFSKALKMDLKSGNKNGISRNLNNIATVYRDNRDYTNALSYFKQALKVAEEQGNLDHIASMNGDVGNMYTLLGQYPKAEKYLLKALSQSREMNALPAIADIEGTLATLYEKWGKHKSALEHYRNQVAVKDSLFNMANIEENLRHEINYEFEKKQAVENAIRDKQVLLLEAENSNQRQVRVLLFIIIGLILVSLLVLKRAYDHKKRLADFLKKESSRKELLLQEVHHRINNNLQIISSLLLLQANSSGDPVLQEYLKQSQQRIQSLSALHELLFAQDSSLEVNIREYLDKILDFHRDILKEKSNRVEIVLNASNQRFQAKTAVPVGLIVNELVTNAIKHAFTGSGKGKIEVELIRDESKNDTFVLRVADNGIGMPASENKKENLGIRLVNMLAKQMKAEISQIGINGTNFVLNFSVKR
jgi:two-component system, sensor histidine kinase PdtaS